MKILKKNQIIVYIIVFILMVVGYLNYSQNVDKQMSLETSTKMESNDDTEVADIGDAVLVNSNNVTNTNDVISENNTTSKEQNQNTENNDETIETSNISDNDYFVQSKLERDKMYSQMLEIYDKILNNVNSLETQKQSATEEIKRINYEKNSIMICENLIKTKGFESSIIFINNDSINIIVGADELKQEEIAQIQNIISREMNAKVENIHIVNKKQN